jgi:hypothetical protein
MTVTSEATGLAAKFQHAVTELTIPGVSRDGLRQQLANAARPLGLSVYTGTIANVGENSAGGNQVQFDDPSMNTGDVSARPQWAFGLARAALLADRSTAHRRGSGPGTHAARVIGVEPW